MLIFLTVLKRQAAQLLGDSLTFDQTVFADTVDEVVVYVC